VGVVGWLLSMLVNNGLIAHGVPIMVYDITLFIKLHVWFAIIFNLWQEPDVHNGVNDDKRASLLMMKFSVNEVEFAIDKLGR
jgi:hypothetical protein